jgi:hypothetical protein
MKSHLGIYSDWVEAAKRQAAVYPLASPGEDAQIASHYERAGHSSSYVGRFYDGPHKFDKQMQEDAFTWLGKMLRRNSR